MIYKALAPAGVFLLLNIGIWCIIMVKRSGFIMGTLFKQMPREEYLSQQAIISKGILIKEIAEELDISSVRS